jgi:hypothetical protein
MAGDVSALSLAWYVTAFGACVLVGNIAQLLVFRSRTGFGRKTGPASAPTSVSASRVHFAESLYFVCLAANAACYFVFYGTLIHGLTRTDIDSDALWDGGPCFGQPQWFVASSVTVLAWFLHQFLFLLLDAIYASTLNRIALANRSRQLQREGHRRFACRAAITAAILWYAGSGLRDIVATYKSADPQLRAAGCLPFTRAEILTPATVLAYQVALAACCAYLVPSLLALLLRNAAVARQTRRYHLPSYELHRAALARIRVFIAFNSASVVVFIIEDALLHSTSSPLPQNLAQAVICTVGRVYTFINGFAFLPRPARRSDSSVTSPMLAAMDASAAARAQTPTPDLRSSRGGCPGSAPAARR